MKHSVDSAAAHTLVAVAVMVVVEWNSWEVWMG